MARASMPDSADPLATVLDAVRAAFAAADIARSSGGKPRVLVALSGGRDSMALLDALGELADELSIALSAVHVHHGLSAQADAWAAFSAARSAYADRLEAMAAFWMTPSVSWFGGSDPLRSPTHRPDAPSVPAPDEATRQAS